MLVGRNPTTEVVLTENHAAQLKTKIPRRIQLEKNWKLLYSMSQHGISLHTLLRLAKGKSPLLLAIKDAAGSVFGAYLSDAFTPHPNFYGSGECFLWKIDEKDKVKVFPWTGKNDYCILCENEFIAVGGGDGQFGLWLDSELENGSSSHCPTFDNEVLSSEPRFICVELEVWCFKENPGR
ncbi:TLD-domain-containing protein [Basidiobolus meristosporus CBS 931.73]|uniref:Oxidation resistance protein 1 n=1 Tax=Basidiobolus meristosporus CBS 931.73 TaxID=1314790 RepID=A0A1Y1YZX2_9FUNG|nr:TLD-domain-containing protein [Basidiobolus meristosporus CBS 931.73]|eukprot:ORY03105.1 TLD-domain-containing protein [Basidiobolus meristosporus CBS 931.73]